MLTLLTVPDLRADMVSKRMHERNSCQEAPFALPFTLNTPQGIATAVTSARHSIQKGAIQLMARESRQTDVASLEELGRYREQEADPIIHSDQSIHDSLLSISFRSTCPFGQEPWLVLGQAAIPASLKKFWIADVPNDDIFNLRELIGSHWVMRVLIGVLKPAPRQSSTLCVGEHHRQQRGSVLTPFSTVHCLSRANLHSFSTAIVT